MSYKGTPASSQIIWLEQRVEQLESGPGGIMEMKQTIADKEKRIEKLEAALQQCEILAEQYQKENEWRAEITNGTTTKAKARAVAARCGMLLGSQRKVIHKALEER